MFSPRHGLAALMTLLQGHHVIGAGMVAHNVIARRATHYERYDTPEKQAAFSGLSIDRVDALQGGAPFPDYLYACGDDHDAGEEAHWEPFQKAAATYIRETYPLAEWSSDRASAGAGLVSSTNPYPPNQPQVVLTPSSSSSSPCSPPSPLPSPPVVRPLSLAQVAFFNGVVSHYIADENWHGLCAGCDNKGLIKQIGYSEFDCTGDLCWDAHHATDMGGEFVAATQTDLSFYPNKNWHIPVTDLVNIFAAMNATCSTDGRTSYCPTTKPLFIRECSVAFYAGSWAISSFGALIQPFISHSIVRASKRATRAS